MLTKLGHRTAFIGKVGDDMFGTQLESALKEVGIGTQGLAKDRKVHTTLAFVHTYPDGDRDFSFYRSPGADIMLTEDEVDPALAGGTRIFHFGSLSMTDPVCRAATIRALDLAREAGAVISFDPNLREPLWETLEDAKREISYGLSRCDILKISDNEIQWFTGEDDFDRAAEKLMNEYPDISLLLLSMGRDGSAAYQGGRKVTAAPFLQENTIETTGAGDTFCACVLHYVLEHGLPGQKWKAFSDGELAEMLAFANAAASLITTRKGALRVMPDREEIEELLHK
jgi:fructokinase